MLPLLTRHHKDEMWITINFHDMRKTRKVMSHHQPLSRAFLHAVRDAIPITCSIKILKKNQIKNQRI